MRAKRFIVAGTVSMASLVAGFAMSARRSASADVCPPKPPGYVLNADVPEWGYTGFSKSEHTPNDHDDVVHKGTTMGVAVAHKTSGKHPVISGQPGTVQAGPQVCNDEPCTITLSTPFFHGTKTLKATSPAMGPDGSGDGLTYYSPGVVIIGKWGALKLLNADGTFQITCGNLSSQRTDKYHDIDMSSATLQKIMQILWNLASTIGTILDGSDMSIEDHRGGAPIYVEDEEGELVLDGNGIPQLNLGPDGGIQWEVLPLVTTRLTSSVSANADHTITYTYLIENLTGDAIPFSVAQVPESATANGWSGTVSGNSSLQTSITVDESLDQDVYVENAYMELKVDGSADFNEAIGGQIYVPRHRAEFNGTCVISSITASPLPAQNHVTILLAGGSAEDIYLYRETPTGAVCVGEMHGNYVADQSYTIDSEDAPPGPVTYYVSVGKGVNKYNSESAETINE